MARFSINVVVVLGVIASMINMADCFLPMRPTLQRLSVKSLRMDSEKVKGDEGLLDPNRMERALKALRFLQVKSYALALSVVDSAQ